MRVSTSDIVCSIVTQQTTPKQQIAVIDREVQSEYRTNFRMSQAAF
jgi:hypothetical protein